MFPVRVQPTSIPAVGWNSVEISFVPVIIISLYYFPQFLILSVSLSYLSIRKKQACGSGYDCGCSNPSFGWQNHKRSSSVSRRQNNTLPYFRTLHAIPSIRNLFTVSRLFHALRTQRMLSYCATHGYPATMHPEY